MEPRTGVIELRDGRRLAYADWGDPDGVPIVHQHGIPGSRLDHEADIEFYRELGVRLITPDRPGYGLSDPLPGRRLLDWPADVAALADHLGIARFGITALSGGGIYALACAAALPERVTQLALAGCPAPMQRPGAMRGTRLMTRLGVWLGAHAPWAMSAGVAALAGVVRGHPDFFVWQATLEKPRSDLRWLSVPSIRAEATMNLREAFRRGGAGYTADLRDLATPWGFALDAIRVPVSLWHGDQDTVIPLHHGEYLAGMLPQARLTVCRGEGHMLMWNHLAEMLDAASGAELRAPEPAAWRRPSGIAAG